MSQGTQVQLFWNLQLSREQLEMMTLESSLDSEKQGLWITQTAQRQFSSLEDEDPEYMAWEMATVCSRIRKVCEDDSRESPDVRAMRQGVESSQMRPQGLCLQAPGGDTASAQRTKYSAKLNWELRKRGKVVLDEKIQMFPQLSM
ncbi:hypothetical protein H920_01477 [Fukomys damarensis]|uniref:Uncharacterized protein n=1 Tax=Fukomys damarensis TaxID=885580 RepID=A0A091E3J3_FUKDA|nr:hypothetical protein H920_01477 [Fukomys damarensis]